MSDSPKFKITPRRDGGPAFARPSGISQEGINTQAQEGMSTLDYFAAEALKAVSDYAPRGEITPEAKEHAFVLARHCYNIAEAFVNEKNRRSSLPQS